MGLVHSVLHWTQSAVYIRCVKHDVCTNKHFVFDIKPVKQLEFNIKLDLLLLFKGALWTVALEYKCKL